MSDAPDADRHAHVRFFKLLEVAYNCARNGHYDRAAGVAEQAVAHYDEVDHPIEPAEETDVPAIDLEGEADA